MTETTDDDSNDLETVEHARNLLHDSQVAEGDDRVDSGPFLQEAAEALDKLDALEVEYTGGGLNE